MNNILLCAASAAGLAMLAALAGCGPEPSPVPPTQTLASMSTEPPPDTLPFRTNEVPATVAGNEAAHDAQAPARQRGGAFGVGIRPTGSGADGIEP